MDRGPDEVYRTGRDRVLTRRGLLGVLGVGTLAGTGWYLLRDPSPGELSPDSVDPHDGFGRAVALSEDGSTALVGANNHSPNQLRTGSVYVFTGSGQSKSQAARFTPEDGTRGALFGSSVAVSNDGSTALVGAPDDTHPDVQGDHPGAAYVFSTSEGSWTQEAKLVAPDASYADSMFGLSVSLSGDGKTALVGARIYDVQEVPNAGSAYVFSRSGESWEHTAKLTAALPDRWDLFGTSVTVSNDGSVALVGAPEERKPNGQQGGAVYAFSRDGGAWTRTAKLASEDGDPFDQFGEAVAVSGDGSTALVGATADEDPNGEAAGSVYAFARSEGGWTEATKFVPEDGGPGDRFGCDVAVSNDGTTAVIGAWKGDEPDGDATGSVYALSASDESWSETSKITGNEAGVNSNFGYTVALAGDGSTAIGGTTSGTDGSSSESAYVFEL